LTNQGFFRYIRPMQADLQRFEEKLNHFVTLFQRLRTENSELRQTIATKSDEIKRMEEKLDQAKTRIEALIAQIPESTTKEHNT
jgi:cell division protein ZapB